MQRLSGLKKPASISIDNLKLIYHIRREIASVFWVGSEFLNNLRSDDGALFSEFRSIQPILAHSDSVSVYFDVKKSLK